MFEPVFWPRHFAWTRPAFGWAASRVARRLPEVWWPTLFPVGQVAASRPREPASD